LELLLTNNSIKLITCPNWNRERLRKSKDIPMALECLIFCLPAIITQCILTVKSQIYQQTIAPCTATKSNS